MDQWRRRARLSARYLIFGALMVIAGWGIIMSQYVTNANAVGFGLCFAGVPLLFLAYREAPGRARN